MIETIKEPLLNTYGSIFLFLIIAMGLSFLLVGLGYLRGPKKPYADKCAPYECGFEPTEGVRLRFNVRFYLVAILFIIFDLEIAFLFPWALVLREIGWPAFGGMMFFLGLLTLGFIYEWKKGALEWE